MARPNIRQIEAFNAVMKAGSITKAAETLFISQPAVSKLIRSFQDSCGFKLFTRGSGRIWPTTEAKRLFLETDKLQAGVARVEKTAKAIRGLERGEVSIVAFPALSFRVVPKYAAKFMRNREDVALQLLTRNSPSVADSMLTGEADFGISLLPSHDPGISCKPFADCSLVCALPPGHRLAQEKCINLIDLPAERFVTLGRADTSYEQVMTTFSEVSLDIHPAIEAQMAEAACTLVSEGLGVSLVPSLISIGWSSDKLIFKPIHPPIRMKMWLYTSAFEPVQKLAMLLMEEIRKGVQEIEGEYDPAPDLPAGSAFPS